MAGSASAGIISSVTFNGTSGPGVASPTITVTGTGFGTRAPYAASDNKTSCGKYTANGEVYHSNLYFQDDGNFEAGYSTRTMANCIGIIAVSWSPTKIVLKFGNAYGTAYQWDLANGDGFAITVREAMWGGTVSGLKAAS